MSAVALMPDMVPGSDGRAGVVHLWLRPQSLPTIEDKVLGGLEHV